MVFELSVDKTLSLMVGRIGKAVTVRRGFFKGCSGRMYQLGRDGRLSMHFAADDRMIRLEVDWLDTDLASRAQRVAFRARRRLVAVPPAILEGWRGILPQRVLNEDFGDYVERVRRLLEDGRLMRAVGVTAEAILCTGLNAIVYRVKEAF